MRKTHIVTLTLSILFLLPGCVLVPLALVGGGIVGGIAISEDTVQSEFEQSYDSVYDASIAVLEKVGAIISQDRKGGSIKAQVPKSKVTVKVEQLTEPTVRVQVKARKTAGVVPDIKTAHSISQRIGEALKEIPVAETAQASQ